MEIKRFITEINDLQRAGRNRNVVYRLAGALTVFCDYDRNNHVHGSYPEIHNWKDRSIIIINCTEEQYNSFVNFAKRNYPNLCNFDVKE